MDKDEIEEQKNLNNEKISIIPLLKIMLDIIYIAILIYSTTLLPPNMRGSEEIVSYKEAQELRIQYIASVTIVKSFKIIIPVFMFLNIILFVNEKNKKTKSIVGAVILLEICVLIYCHMHLVIS